MLGRWRGSDAVMRFVPFGFFVLSISAVMGSSLGCAEPTVVSIPVPNKVIYSGDIVSVDAITDKKISPLDQQSLKGAALDRNDVVGRVATRTLLPGQPISAWVLVAASTVKQGQTVIAVYEDGNLVISASVIALSSAATGGALIFQGAENSTVQRGIVQMDGTVRVLAR